MVKKSPDEFKIQFSKNDDYDDIATMREEIFKQRLEKLSTRVTLISILVPVLMIVIFTFAYMDIRTRIYSMQDTGVGELQKLSRDLESKFSSLSVRFAKFEDSFTQRENSLKGIEESFSKRVVSMEKSLATLESSIDDVKKNLGETEKNITQIVEIQSGYAEKKEVEAIFEAMDKSMDTVQNDMQTVISQMKALDDNFKDELKLLTDYLAKDKKRIDGVEKVSDGLSEEIKNIQTEFRELSKKTEGFVRTGDLPLAVEKARLSLKVALDEAVMKMQNRMDVLERQLSLLSSQSEKVLERDIQ